MTEPKQIKGILDYVSLKPGEEWENAPITEDYIPGMGTGASKEAIRWAYKGFLSEMKERLLEVTVKTEPRIKKRRIGPPEKKAELRIDNLRAYYLWYIVRDLSESYRCELTNRAAIKLVNGYPLKGKTKAAWHNQAVESIEQSVSRGRKFWHMDNRWNSKKCEQFHAKYD